jgi:hypothetical protein
MGKTFRKNEAGRRPKWDKHGKKSKKQQDFEDDFSKYKNRNQVQYQPEE